MNLKLLRKTESKMPNKDEFEIAEQDRIKRVYYILKREVKFYKVPIVDLVKVQTKDPFKVLVATILSARSKDEMTAGVAKRLFGKISKPNDLNQFSIKELEELIFPIGFYHNKAQYLKRLPGVLEKEFSNTIPDNVEDLMKLPGVGRKTANLVVAVAFEKPAV